jgi:hypothetical protein
MPFIGNKLSVNENLHAKLTQRKDCLMTDKKLTEMLEESWYFSVIENIVKLFEAYGRDNVLTDVANRLIEIESQGKQ